MMMMNIKMERNRILVNQTNNNNDDDCAEDGYRKSTKHWNMVDWWSQIEESDTINLWKMIMGILSPLRLQGPNKTNNQQ